ncbi:hypothetical protein TUM12370_06290 [Salmonella enterica subsp. enterica serovar Choleraesuis]|nr:hypothetical protein TUM12370_06290 [Salmonella enterica subsp. enterica serovar Choleraesuis]
MTFSIAGRCPHTGQLGIAISSSSIAVGARCPWLLAGVGAVSSQNITLPALGPRILEQLAQGHGPDKALSLGMADDPFSDWRQVTVLDAKGNSAVFSGSHSLGTYHSVQGEQCVAAGNMLASPQVIEALVSTFEQTPGPLAARLLAAMHAALDAGGEAGPVHSAAVKVAGEHSWPIVDLRVDWHDSAPLDALSELWIAYEPQLEAYQTRALDPRTAPSYGVPGDE